MVRAGVKPNHGVLQALCRKLGLSDVKCWWLLRLDPQHYVGVVAGILKDFAGQEQFPAAGVRTHVEGISDLERLTKLVRRAVVVARAEDLLNGAG